MKSLCQSLCAAVAVALLAGCSTGTSIAPRPEVPLGHAHKLMPLMSAVAGPLDMLKVHPGMGRSHFKSFNSCPATGQIEYISDYSNDVVDIYAGNFNGQAPCGMITSANTLGAPQGLFVNGSTHDLYVADSGNYEIEVFHRGQTTWYKAYVDLSNGLQEPVDVTVAADNTVIATNIVGFTSGIGSISTWNKTTGTLIGNFPNPGSYLNYFLTVQKNGTVYFDDNSGKVYSGSCPLGACGTFTPTGATVDFPGGIRSADGEDLVVQDQTQNIETTYETFPNGNACYLESSYAVGFDINKSQKHYFFTDAYSGAIEVKYPSCTYVIGTVAGNPGGTAEGVAVDPPESL
jgi:hypothetical protein